MMEFSGRLVKEDLDDVARLLRPRLYWLSFILETWHGTALLLVIVWATILGLLGQTKPNWWAMGVVWALIAGILIWTGYKLRRDRAQELARLDATLPDRFKLTTEGIKWTERAGGEALLPWTDITAWRERGRVVAIDQRAGTPAVILSVGNLPETERQRLRAFLRSQIPPSPRLDRPLDRSVC